MQALALADEAGLDVRGATAIIHGHYYACEACCRALLARGVAQIVLDLEGVVA